MVESRSLPTMTDTERLATLLAHHEIGEVIHRYCRGIDRMDWDLVRGCYHPDAVDDHGDFVGTIDEFIPYIQAGLPRFERTQHFIGNLMVELDGDTARAETYLVAYHRLRANATKPERDFVVGLRYVDDFARRAGEWRIARRVCAFEWSRIDPVAAGGWTLAPRATTGQRDRTDVVYAPSLVAPKLDC